MAEETKNEIVNFKFEVSGDNIPEFKSAYEIVFKSAVLYADESGTGRGMPSHISGGLAGNGHNNIVTGSSE